jgi:hypothetical protein
MDPEIGPLGDQTARFIPQLARFLQANVWVSTERDPGLLVAPGKPEVPMLCALRSYEECWAVGIVEDIVLAVVSGGFQWNPLDEAKGERPWPQ